MKEALPGMPDLDGMLLEVVAANAKDPITRFIESIQDRSLRRYAEETRRLRGDFETHCRRVLAPIDPRDALASAEWLRLNAQEVAYRWAGLVRIVTRWGHLQTEATVFRVQRVGT
jgi:hypothetical protein